MKNQNGFTIVAALGVGVLLGATSMVIVSMKRSIDNDIRNTSIKHALSIADDVVKTQIAIRAREVVTRGELDAFVRSFAPGANPDSGFRVPVSGTDCGNSLPCYIRLLPHDKNNPSSTLVPPFSSTSSEITLRMGLSPEDNAKLKFKVEPLELKIKLPLQAELNGNNVAQNAGDMICPISKPIFKGIKQGPRGSLEKECVDIPSGTNLQKTSSALQRKITCNVSQGYWMSAFNADITPSCSLFPEGTRSPASIDFCPEGQVVKSYEFNGSFGVENLQCVNKGKPYDFMELKKSWGSQ